MKHFSTRTALVLAIGAFACTACGAIGGGGEPATASASQSAASPLTSASNLSGEWSGKFHDSEYGKGKGTTSYAQYQTAIGGVLNVKYSTGTITASVVLAASGTTVDGTVIVGTGSLYCSFATKGTYDPTTYTIDGSYKAVYGCGAGSGKAETGSFALKHDCYYIGGNGSDVRPSGGPMHC